MALNKIVPHTPGPWVTADFDPETIDVHAPWSEKVKPAEASGYGDYRGIYICTLKHQGDNDCVSKRQAESNARLIAAAPNLLTACKALLGIDNPPAGDPKHIDYADAVRMAQEAIRKAEGEAP